MCPALRLFGSLADSGELSEILITSKTPCPRTPLPSNPLQQCALYVSGKKMPATLGASAPHQKFALGAATTKLYPPSRYCLFVVCQSVSVSPLLQSTSGAASASPCRATASASPCRASPSSLPSPSSSPSSSSPLQPPCWCCGAGHSGSAAAADGLLLARMVGHAWHHTTQGRPDGCRVDGEQQADLVASEVAPRPPMARNTDGCLDAKNACPRLGEGSKLLHGALVSTTPTRETVDWQRNGPWSRAEAGRFFATPCNSVNFRFHDSAHASSETFHVPTHAQ